MNEVVRSRRVPRFLSCLVKGPLGCLSFALGAAAVLVLFLPPALGRIVERWCERGFAERHAGRLELADAWLGSLYGPQRVESVILRDPEGDEVLRGEIVGPSLSAIFDGPLHRYGPVVARIEVLRVLEGPDGATNLERALRELPRELPPRPLRDLERGVETDVPFEIALELTIERLRYSSASGKEALLEGLAFHGTLEWGPDVTHLVLEGGSDPAQAEGFHARVELQRPEFGLRRPWSSALALSHAPTMLARALCAAVRPLVPFAGPELDRLQWSRDGSEVALRIEDEGARFELLGEVGEDPLVVVEPGRALTVTLPCANERGRELLARLLPLVEGLECVDAGGLHELRLEQARWPLDADWRRLGGDLVLALAPARCALVPALRSALGESAGLVTRAAPLEAVLRIREGGMQVGAVRLPLEDGWLQVEGAVELLGEDAAFTVTGERSGAPLEPFSLAGTGDAVAPQPPVVPQVPEGGEGLPAPPPPPR